MSNQTNNEMYCPEFPEEVELQMQREREYQWRKRGDGSLIKGMVILMIALLSMGMILGSGMLLLGAIVEAGSMISLRQWAAIGFGLVLVISSLFLFRWCTRKLGT